MFLTADQIADLTSKQRPHAQARVLDGIGVEYLRRPDGSLVVLLARVEQKLGMSVKEFTRKKTKPDFSMVH